LLSRQPAKTNNAQATATPNNTNGDCTTQAFMAAKTAVTARNTNHLRIAHRQLTQVTSTPVRNDVLAIRYDRLN
jgi:hypothetical protein